MQRRVRSLVLSFMKTYPYSTSLSIMVPTPLTFRPSQSQCQSRIDRLISMNETRQLFLCEHVDSGQYLVALSLCSVLL